MKIVGLIFDGHWIGDLTGTDYYNNNAGAFEVFYLNEMPPKRV